MSLFAPPPLEAPEEDPSLLERIRTNADAAADYLRDRWDAFVNLSPAIIDLQHRAALAAGAARERGDTEAYENARAVIRALGQLNVKHGQAVDTMRSVAQYVGLGGYAGTPYLGLGVAIPAAQVTVITGLALLVAWFFRAYAAEERKLELIEAGILTPEQAAMLDPGPAPAVMFGQVAGFAKLALLGFGLWIAFQALQTFGAPRRRRARRNPPLMIFDSNPPGGVIGEETLAVYYQHADDGEYYVHEFGEGVELIAEPDGSVRLEHRYGRELWDEFELEAEDGGDPWP